MKCKLIREMDKVKKDPVQPRHPVGTIIDHPDAYRLVQMGCAVPEDGECKVKANMTDEEMLKAQWHYERTNRGIVPEDFQAYEKGYMEGYNSDGSWKPGPNYEEHAWGERKRESPLIIVDEE